MYLSIATKLVFMLSTNLFSIVILLFPLNVSSCVCWDFRIGKIWGGRVCIGRASCLNGSGDVLSGCLSRKKLSCKDDIWKLKVSKKNHTKYWLKPRRQSDLQKKCFYNIWFLSQSCQTYFNTPSLSFQDLFDINDIKTSFKRKVYSILQSSIANGWLPLVVPSPI